MFAKGQIKPKADLRAVDSPKKLIIEFVVVFVVKSKKVKKTQQIRSFVFGRIYGTSICLRFHLTFTIFDKNSIEKCKKWLKIQTNSKSKRRVKNVIILETIIF